MTIAEKLQTIAENEQKVFEAGKKSEYDRFWDAYQNNGSLSCYSYSFAGDGWHDGTYKPKYPIVCKWNGAYMTFGYAYMTDTIVPIYVDATTTLLNYTFNCARELKTIREIHITETTGFSNTFYDLVKLENLTFVGTIGQNGLNLQWSTKLSKASIENIIGCLSTSTSGLTVTLSKTAVDTAFTETEWATLIATKPNWSISLV